MPDEYLDCELYLTDRDQARLSIGERQYSGKPQLDEEIEVRLRSLLTNPKEYGSELFSALLPASSKLHAGYRAALTLAGEQGRSLRLRLHIADTAPAELHGLRWELLFDRSQSLALACARNLAFSRYLSLPDPVYVAGKERPKLLIALANPSDLVKEFGLPPMDRQNNLRALQRTLAPYAGQLSCEILEEPTTAARLRQRLAEGGIYALHLQAHGLLRDGEGPAGLVLEGEDGRADLVDEERFSLVFEGHRTLRLITLVACHGGRQTGDDPFSGLGPALVRRGVPAVVAMRQAISFSAAARFCESLYSNLARSGCIDAAVNEARSQLLISNLDGNEFGTPVLFMRLGDGLLWDPMRSEPAFTADAGTEGEIEWDQLVENLRSDNLLPFLGPGLWRGVLPSRAEIAARWVEKYQGSFPLDVRTELPAVAQVLETRKGGSVPHDKMLRVLASELIRKQDEREQERLRDLTLSEVIDRIGDRHFDRSPEDPHRILAELPISTYVTTNPDSLMTAALRWKGKKPIREQCPWRRPPASRAAARRYTCLRGTKDEPLVFHMYGSDEDPTSLVLTEDNHLDFLLAIARGDAELPDSLKKKMGQAMLLFLGYDVRRLDCRVLLRGLLDHFKEAPRGRIAVLQVDPEEEVRSEELASYMAKCCSRLDINVYKGSVQDFLLELREQWTRR